MKSPSLCLGIFFVLMCLTLTQPCGFSTDWPWLPGFQLCLPSPVPGLGSVQGLCEEQVFLPPCGRAPTQWQGITSPALCHLAYQEKKKCEIFMSCVYLLKWPLISRYRTDVPWANIPRAWRKLERLAYVVVSFGCCHSFWGLLAFPLLVFLSLCLLYICFRLLWLSLFILCFQNLVSLCTHLKYFIVHMSW